VHALFVDDQVSLGHSRYEARDRVEHFLSTGQIGKRTSTGEVVSINETPQEREERLRKNWGNDLNAQTRWAK
jgi:hypothetical protein